MSVKEPGFCRFRRKFGSLRTWFICLFLTIALNAFTFTLQPRFRIWIGDVSSRFGVSTTEQMIKHLNSRVASTQVKRGTEYIMSQTGYNETEESLFGFANQNQKKHSKCEKADSFEYDHEHIQEGKFEPVVNESVSNAHACCHLCEQHTTCTHWSYINDNSYCQLRNNSTSVPAQRGRGVVGRVALDLFVERRPAAKSRRRYTCSLEPEDAPLLSGEEAAPQLPRKAAGALEERIDAVAAFGCAARAAVRV